MAERIRGPRAIVGIRRRTVDVATSSWEVQWRGYFRGFQRRYMAAWSPPAKAATFHVKQGPGSAFWLRETQVSRDLLNQQYAAMTQTVWSDVVSAQVGRAVDFDLNSRGVSRILGQVGTRVTGITEASQRMIADRVDAGIRDGANTDRLEASIRDLLQSWGEPGGRAHIIALTESGNAYNLAATEGYRESGIVEMVEVYDGPDCGWTEHDDPDLADGSKRTLEEADAYPLSHPHCQRAFGPVVLTDEEADSATAQAVSQEEPATEVDPGIQEPEPPALTREEQISVQEERIRGLTDHEVGIAVGDDGTVLVDKLGEGQSSTAYGSVTFTDAELAAMRGQTLIHNHPGGWIEGWREAGSFSPDDLLLQLSYGIREMRVVGKNVNYRAWWEGGTRHFLFRKESEAANKAVRLATEEWLREQKRIAREAAKIPGGGFDLRAYAAAEKELLAEANSQHWHRVWTRVSEAIPQFHYERTILE